MIYQELKGYKYLNKKAEVFETDIKGLVFGHEYFELRPDGLLLVRKQYAWDGPSGPAIDTKTFMLGSLVHDVLYQAMREGLLSRDFRKQADQEMRKVCLEQGMWKFRAWYAYRFVRLFAKKSSMPRKNPRGKIVEI